MSSRLRWTVVGTLWCLTAAGTAASLAAPLSNATTLALDTTAAGRFLPLGPVGGNISALQFDTNPDPALWASTFEALFALRPETRAWRWQLSREIEREGLAGGAPAFDPWQPGRLLLATAVGLWRSENNGIDFERLEPLPRQPRLVDQLLASGGRAGQFVARQGQDLFTSDDAGESWQETAVDVDRVALDPLGFLIAARRSGLATLNEQGTWTTLGALPLDPVHGFPVFAGQLVAAVDGWIYLDSWRSPDRGASWSRYGSSAPGAFTQLAVDPRVPARLFGATREILYRSDDHGGSWRAVWRNPTGERGFPGTVFTFHPDGNRLIVAGGTADQLVIVASGDGGESFVPVSSRGFRALRLDRAWQLGADTYAELGDQRLRRGPGDPGFRRVNGLSRSDLGLLALTSAGEATGIALVYDYARQETRLLRSADHGESWMRVGRAASASGAALAFHGPLGYLVEPGRVQMSRDGGVSWRSWPAHGTSSTGYFELFIDPTDPAHLILHGYHEACSGPACGIDVFSQLESTDQGRTWESLPLERWVLAIAPNGDLLADGRARRDGQWTAAPRLCHLLAGSAESCRGGDGRSRVLVAGSAIYVAHPGRSQVLRSVNAGRSYQPITVPLTHPALSNLFAVATVGRHHLLLVGTSAGLWQTAVRVP